MVQPQNKNNVANILIYSNNPNLIAQCSHVLLSEHNVSRLLNAQQDYQADAIIFDAKKLDEDANLLKTIAGKNIRFLVVGMDWPEQKQIDVLVHGAAGYCESSEISYLLNRAIECILHGDIWIRRALVPKVIGVLTGHLHGLKTPSPLAPEKREELIKMADSLSEREVEVANLIRKGENNKGIAQVMNISERTVKAHLSSIFRKFEVDDRLRLAIRLKEIDQYR